MTGNGPERQRLIVDWLATHEYLRNHELCERLAVTPMTLWRDLVCLEDKGLVKRLHGRVTRADSRIVEPDFHSKIDKAALAKRRIAAYAAAHFIHEGDNLAIDGGTTVALIADQSLAANVSFFTNSLHTASLLLNHPARPAVYVCGGLLRAQSGTFIGREALTFFSRRRTQRYFLSATGVDAEAGVTDLTLEDNEVKQAIAAASGEVILLADQTKFGVVSLMQVLPWRRIHHLITDAPAALTGALVVKNPQLIIHRV